MIPLEELAPKKPDSEKNLPERLADAQLLVLEMEGVLTDGRVFNDSLGGQALFTHRHDEIALAQWLATGRRVLVLARPDLSAAEKWCGRLGLDFLAVKGDKSQAIRVYAHEARLRYGQICYMGADLDDLVPMMMIGVSACPAQAPAWVSQVVDFVASVPAGHGAVRQLVDLALQYDSPSTRG